VAIKGVQPLNLGSRFEATVTNQNAPPPELPLETMQAIGTKFCQIPPGEMSTTAMNYDSSDE
jgi:TATA-binding protein-associated factor Taf7